MRYFETIIIALAISLGSIAAYQKFILPKYYKKIYVVNTSKLIAAEKKILKAGLEKGKLNVDEVKRLDKKFVRIINYIARKDNAIVIVKRAVLSGNYDKDITNEVLMLAIEGGK